MYKKLIVSLVLGGLLSACASSNKTDDSVAGGEAANINRMNEWGSADITDLNATALSEQFKAQTQPVVYFDFNSVALTQDAMNALGGQVEWLKANPNAMIVIEGHCDERGTREYNLALGERRAMAVQDYFLLKGIEQGRIRTISYGKERPDALGSTEDAWAKNRRAVTLAN